MDVLFSVLDDNLTSSVVTTLRAYTMIHYSSTAVRAGCKGRDGSKIVSTSLVSSLL